MTSVVQNSPSSDCEVIIPPTTLLPPSSAFPSSIRENNTNNKTSGYHQAKQKDQKRRDKNPLNVKNTTNHHPTRNNDNNSIIPSTIAMKPGLLGRSLTHINLNKSKLMEFPQSLFLIHYQIQSLYLNHNELKSLPHQFHHLFFPVLESLSITFNQLSVLPHGIGTMVSLRYLNLKGNPLNGNEIHNIKGIQHDQKNAGIVPSLTELCFRFLTKDVFLTSSISSFSHCDTDHTNNNYKFLVHRHSNLHLQFSNFNDYSNTYYTNSTMDSQRFNSKNKVSRSKICTQDIESHYILNLVLSNLEFKKNKKINNEGEGGSIVSPQLEEKKKNRDIKNEKNHDMMLLLPSRLQEFLNVFPRLCAHCQCPHFTSYSSMVMMIPHFLLLSDPIPFVFDFCSIGCHDQYMTNMVTSNRMEEDKKMKRLLRFGKNN